MVESDLLWLAGYLEGEGSFMKGPPSKPNQPVITFVSTDEDICARAAGLLGVVYYGCKTKKAHHKRSFRAALRAARELFPHMGIRRRAQIERALASYTKYSSRVLDESKVRAVKDCHLKVKEACRHFGISPATYFRVRSETGVYARRPAVPASEAG
jgi:hypothetical protein